MNPVPAPIYPGTRIPSPIPTMLQVPEELDREADILEVNFGPNHPSTHGVLRLVVQLDGETVVGLKAVIGYLHTGFEKSMEQKTWWKAIPYAPRMDYVAFQANELAFVMAVEKLLGIEQPPKSVWMRTLLLELNRIHSHLVWLGTSALELGAVSPVWYAFRERDRVLDLFELVTGVRMHTRYVQVGGLADDVPRGFFPQCREFHDVMPGAIDEYEAMLTENPIWRRRTKGVGLLSAEDAIALGQSGPVLRASGVDWDLRKAEPYLAYGDVDFDVPVKENGDVWDRYKIHMDEIRQSSRLTLDVKAAGWRIRSTTLALKRWCSHSDEKNAVGLLHEHPRPTEREVREGLEGNLCRCTGYHNIVRAVLRASGQDPDAADKAAPDLVAPGFSAGSGT